MYAREIDGEERSFGVSGKLWHGVLVMFDRETGSLWTQLDGRAIRGAERGERLEHVPSVVTTWGAWKRAHPDTLVLEKPAEQRAGSAYADYFADPDRLFLPELAEGIGAQIPPKTVVFGIRHPGGSVALPEERLAREGVVSARAGDEPVAFLRHPRTGAVRGVSRRFEGEVLELEPIDGVPPTERVRDAASGRALPVDELEELRVDRAYWYAWARTVGGDAAPEQGRSEPGPDAEHGG